MFSASSVTLAAELSGAFTTSTGTSPDVLALKIGKTTDPGGGVHFVSFHNGAGQSLGAIQGNGSGGVTLAGAGNEIAAAWQYYEHMVINDDLAQAIAEVSAVSPWEARMRFDKAIPRHIERIFDTGQIIED